MQLKEIREGAARELTDVTEKAAAELDETRRNAAQAMEQAREADKKEIASLKGQLSSIDMENAKPVREIRQDADRKLAAQKAESARAYNEMEKSLKETIETERADRQKLVDAEKARIRENSLTGPERKTDRSWKPPAERWMKRWKRPREADQRAAGGAGPGQKGPGREGREQAREAAEEQAARIRALTQDRDRLKGVLEALNRDLGCSPPGGKRPPWRSPLKRCTCRDRDPRRRDRGKGPDSQGRQRARSKRSLESREAMDAVIGRLEEMKEKLA